MQGPNASFACVQVQDGMQERVSGLLSQISALESQVEAQQTVATEQRDSSCAEVASLNADLRQSQGQTCELNEQLAAVRSALEGYAHSLLSAHHHQNHLASLPCAPHSRADW